MISIITGVLAIYIIIGIYAIFLAFYFKLGKDREYPFTLYLAIFIFWPKYLIKKATHLWSLSIFLEILFKTCSAKSSSIRVIHIWKYLKISLLYFQKHSLSYSSTCFYLYSFFCHIHVCKLYSIIISAIILVNYSNRVHQYKSVLFKSWASWCYLKYISLRSFYHNSSFYKFKLTWLKTYILDAFEIKSASSSSFIF